MSRASRPIVSGAIVLGVCVLTVGTLHVLAPVGDLGWGDPPPAVALTAQPEADAGRDTGAASRAEVRTGAPVAVTLSLDGVEIPLTSAAATVSDLLVAQGVVLDGYATSHELDAPLEAGMRVVVAKVTWGDDTVETPVPFETVEVEDPALPEGERVVRTAGRAGTAVTTYLVSLIDGSEVSRSEVVSVTTRPATDEVVRVGTGAAERPAPTRGAPPAAAPTRTPAAPRPAADPAPSGPDDSAAPEPSATPDAEPSPAPVATEAPSGTPGTTPASAKALARTMAADRGWTGKQLTCLVSLWDKESGWRYDAANPSSTARGIPQALMSIHFGSGWRTSAAAARYLSTPSVQIAWGLSYIGNRYDAPCDAWAHSQGHGWY